MKRNLDSSEKATMINPISRPRKINWSTIQYSVLAAAILIRSVALILLWHQPLMGDPVSYNEVALQIVAGARYYPYWPPGLPLYLAAWHLVFGSAAVVSRVALFALFIGFVLLLRKFLNELVGERLGTIGLAVIAIYPVFVDYAIDPLTHLPIALCLLAILFCLKRLFATPTIRYAALLGLSISIMVLFRASSSLILFAVPLFCAWKLKSIRIPLVTVAVAGVVIGAWLLRANDLAGEYLWINGSNDQNFYFGNSPYTPDYRTWWIGSHGGEGLADSAKLSQLRDSVDGLGHHAANMYYRGAATQYIEDHPARFLLRTANRVATFFVFDTFTSGYAKNVGVPKWGVLGVLLLDAACYLSLLTLALGYLIFYARKAFSEPLTQLMILLLLLYAMPYWIAFSSSVYHTPLLPIFLVFGLLFLSNSPISSWRDHLRARFTGRQKLMFGCAICYLVFVQIQFVLNMASRF